MRIRVQLAAALTVLLLVAANFVGCESSDITAPMDAQIIVRATPQTVIIDREAGETEGVSVITAQLFDAQGFPLDGIAVSFSTTAGTLATEPPPGQPPITVETNSSGTAADTLTMTLNDPAEAVVTAQSATLSNDVTVNLDVDVGNQPPDAVVTISPSGGQAIDSFVTFNASLSSDPDFDPITCYQWIISSSLPAIDPVVFQGETMSNFTESYSAEQTLTVQLRVSDVPNPGTFCNDCDAASLGCEAAASFFGAPDTVDFYEITCDPTPPVADIAGSDRTVSLSPPANGEAGLSSNSFDPEFPFSSFVDWVWTCGTAQEFRCTTPPDCGIVEPVTCTYLTTGPKTVQLRIDSQPPCTGAAIQTAADQITITVVP